MATPPNNAPKTVTIGSGWDTIVLHVSQDWYLTNAQYNVMVDGVKVGATQTVSAMKAKGQFDTVNVKCNLIAGSHTVDIIFLNDNWDGGTGNGHDVNIYVDYASFDGAQIPNVNLTILNADWPHTITFDPKALAPQQPPKSVTLGTGPDSLVFHICQTWYLANASYNVTVDGVQIGANQTVSSIRNQGNTDTVTVNGTFAAGNHTVAINFLNPANDGSTPAAPNFHIRSIWVSNVSFNGTAVSMPDMHITLATDPHTFTFSKAASGGTGIPNNPATTTTIGSGPDAIVMHVSQDWYQTNCLYSVAVDGVQQNGTITASAIKAQGLYDTVTINGTFAAGNHTVTFRLLNDDWDGTWGPDGNTPNGHDRNIYVSGVTFDGTAVSGSSLTILNSDPMSFTFSKAGAPPGPGPGPAGYPQVLTNAGITDARLTFSDEFDTLEISNDGTKKWRSDGDPNAYSISNGILTLSVWGNLRSFGNYPGGFLQSYGYYEARLRAAGGTNAWTGFYLSGQSYADYGLEIDIIEDNGTSDVYSTGYNVWKAPGYGNVSWDQAPWNVDPQGTTWDSVNVSTVNLWQDFHTYGMLWKPGVGGGHDITMYLDDQVVAHFTVAASLGSADTIGSEIVIQNFLNNQGGTTDDPLLIDWVRVWQLPGL